MNRYTIIEVAQAYYRFKAAEAERNRILGFAALVPPPKDAIRLFARADAEWREARDSWETAKEDSDYMREMAAAIAGVSRYDNADYQSMSTVCRLLSNRSEKGSLQSSRKSCRIDR